MRKYKSDVMRSVHQGVTDLFESGLVDQTTMRRFDASCLSPLEQFEPADVRALRERERVSQAVFAEYLAVSVNTIGQWERGERKPNGPTLKLLSLVKAHGLQYIR